jgi:hypothetical protein
MQRGGGRSFGNRGGGFGNRGGGFGGRGGDRGRGGGRFGGGRGGGRGFQVTLPRPFPVSFLLLPSESLIALALHIFDIFASKWTRADL